jgi:hypothetical protein
MSAVTDAATVASPFKAGDRIRAIVRDLMGGWVIGSLFTVERDNDGPHIIDLKGARRDPNIKDNSGEFEKAALPCTAPARVAWGAEIQIDGKRRKRPDWLRKGDFVRWYRGDMGDHWWDANSPKGVDAFTLHWGGFYTIRLPANHPYYAATAKGFTYWPGGDCAPADADGGEVLARGGNIFRTYSDWRHGAAMHPNCEIIGYRKAYATLPAAEVIGKPISEWGAKIPLDGYRPDWLDDSDRFTRNGGPSWLVHQFAASDWMETEAIQLVPGHWAYEPIKRGFTPWAGGATAPADWDGGKALLRDGAIFMPTSKTHSNWQRGYAGDCARYADLDIIGYNHRAFAAPETPPAPTLSFSAADIADIVTNSGRLAERVKELLDANNGLVEEVRDIRRDFEKSQDDLATVTADRDEWVAAFRDLNSRFQRHEDAARKTLAMSAKAGAAWAAAAEAPEYVFGPWVNGGEFRAPVNAPYEWRCINGSQPYPGIKFNSGSLKPEIHEFRRAYRIGEWHDWDGTKAGPFEQGVTYNVDWGDAKSDRLFTAHSDQDWSIVKRFLPISAPAQPATIFPIISPSFFHLGAAAE